MNYRFNQIIEMPQGKYSGYWQLEECDYIIPFTYIKGPKVGKKICISSGVHCCEYVGIVAAQELSKEIEWTNVTGEVIILHPVNYNGFFAKIPAVFPEDKENLNRKFPGDKNGTLTERIAYNFSNYLYKHIDFFLDLHGGDLHENITPLAFCPGLGDENIVNLSHEVANHLTVPIRVRSGSSKGAYSSGVIQGVPGILLERGGSGLWNKELVEADKKDVYITLKFFDVYNQCELIKQKNQLEITKATYIDSKHNGFWYPYYEPGDKVKKGSILGIIKDCFSNELEVIYSEYDCIIMYETVSLSIQENEPLIAYGEI